MIYWIIPFLLIAIAGPIYLLLTGSYVTEHWSRASSGSAGVAPDPRIFRGAVIQVYAARVWGKRGAVAVHTWVAVKPSHAESYTTYQIIGWRLYSRDTALVIRSDIPDRHWYGNRPWLLADLRGEGVDKIIDAVHKAAMRYPYAYQYRLWPGPNSNTFTAWVARQVPELKVDMPPTAIGKDYLGARSVLAKAPSGTGYQLSLLGALGVTVGVEEGIEFNIGCVHFGIDPLDLGLRLPGLGNVSLLSDSFAGDSQVRKQS